MPKIFKAVLIAAVIVGAAFLTGGLSIAPSLSITTAIGGVELTSTVIAGGLIASTGGLLALAAAATVVLGGIQAQLAKTPRSPLGQLDRLNASINPRAPRTMWLGTTAGGTDIRYVEPSGTDQEYIDYIVGTACHKVTSTDELWLEDQMAWSSSGGITAAYTGYLTVDTVLEGNASNYVAINGGAKWGSTRLLTGCAYLHMRIKRSGNDKSAQSPFASGLASRMTIRGKGMPLYDPRRDSSVGGSGTMRADDQTTWSFAPGGTEIGNNTALQILGYLLGWKINGKLSVGCGLPAARINMAAFMDAATLCEEAVARSAGGTEPRYRSAGIVSEADDPTTALQVLLAACNGRLRDDGGVLSLAIMHNDLATASGDAGLGDSDILGAFTYDPDPDLSGSFNVVRGQYTDSSDASLYQPVDYPEVSLESTDGIDRVLTLNLLGVESASQAQRIAKQALERKQYDRTFTALFSNRAWKYRIGDVVPITFTALGFAEKLFRIQSQTITYDGTCPMVLTEENAAIYAWDASDAAPVTAADPTVYDPLNDPLIVAIGALDDASASALADLEAIASDGVLSKGEKPRVVLDYTTITGEQAGIDARATAQGITTEKTTYDSAVTSLTAYLASLTPAYTDYTTDTTIVSATFISQFSTVYTTRQVLLNKIAKSAYDQASTAATNASSALTQIVAISADSVLSKGEKPTIVKDYNVIIAEQAGIDAQATAQSITTEKTTYDAAVTALTTYLASISPAFTDYTQDSAIVSATFNSKFQDVYVARQAVLNKADGTTFTIATNGLNADGTVKTNKVGTVALIDNSVSATFGATMPSPLTGSAGFAWQSAVSQTFVMAAAGDLITWSDIKQGYSSGTFPQAWDIRVLVDGSQVNTKGGAGFGTDSGSIQAIKSGLAAGSHTVELQWRGDNSNLTLNSASMEGIYRYK